MQGKENKEDKMSVEGFIKAVQLDVKKLLGRDYQVVINEITKNNSLVLQGLVIQDKEHNLFPTIYLEKFYDQYIQGAPVEELVNRIIDCYKKSMIHKEFDTTLFTDWNHAKNNIVFKLVNYESNMKLLEEVPHEKFLDLAIVFYYIFDLETDNMATVLIRNQHMELWNKTGEDLSEIAKINSVQLLPCEIKNMVEVLGEMVGDMDEAEMLELVENEDSIPMYVMSNSKKISGAACILYPGELKKFSDKMESDIIILPSSIHELLLIPAFKGKEDCETFIAMVRDVNETQVQADEVLSDNVYYYNRKDDIIEVVVGQDEEISIKD